MNGYGNSDIKRLLHPYAKRIRRKLWLKRFGFCACVGVGAGILVLLLSFLAPIRYAPLLAVVATAGVCIASGLVLALLPQNPMYLAMEIDRYGFQERVQTLVALQESDSPFARLQREDTFQVLQSADPKAQIPVKGPKQPYMLAGIGILLACLLAILPSPQSGILRERAEINKVLREQLEKVETSIDLLEKNNTLTEAQKLELNEQLQELAQELRDGQDYKESVKQISQLQQELSEAQSRQNQQDMNALREIFEDNPLTEDLAENIENQTPEQAAEEIQQAVRQAMEEGEEQAGELAQALREAAQGLGNEEWLAALEGVADAMEQGDESGISEALSGLSDAMSGSSSQSDSLEQIKEQLQQAKNQIGKLGQDDDGDSDGGPSSQSGGNGDDSSQSNKGQQGQQQQGDGTGTQGNQGEGQGQGSGNGQTGTNGSGESGQNGSGAGSGSGDLVDGEKVYSGERLDADGDLERLQGEVGAQGPKQQLESSAGGGTLDGYIPYQQVAGEYAQDAINAAKREGLPPAVQDWIKAYFSALQD